MEEHDGYQGVRARAEVPRAEVPSDDDRMVMVCASCLCASCWQGEFMCDASHLSSTVDKPVRELRALNRENSDYWAPGYR